METKENTTSTVKDTSLGVNPSDDTSLDDYYANIEQ